MNQYEAIWWPSALRLVCLIRQKQINFCIHWTKPVFPALPWDFCATKYVWLFCVPDCSGNSIQQWIARLRYISSRFWRGWWQQEAKMWNWYYMQRIMEALVLFCPTGESSGESEDADVQQRRGHGRPGGHHGRPGGHHGGSHGGRIKLKMVMMVNFVITMYTWYKNTMYPSNGRSLTLYLNGNWTRPLLDQIPNILPMALWK